MNFKEYVYTKVIPTKIIEKWEGFKNGKMLFKCLPNGEFYDNGAFSRIADNSGYFSQYGQDMFLDRVVFPNKSKGIFVDIGGNHPIRLNNTYFFERKGWTGLAFEPQQKFQQEWKEKRTTVCLQYALGATDCMIDFVESIDDDQTCSGIQGVVELSAHSAAYKVHQRRLQDVFDEYSMDKIDFISIDVEGYEYEVLKGIDYSKTDIKCLVIENNKRNELPDLELRNWILDKGYCFVGRIVIDDVFVKI